MPSARPPETCLLWRRCRNAGISGTDQRCSPAFDPPAAMPLSKNFTPNGSPRTLRRLGTWAVAAALLVGNLFLHKPISDICDNLYATIGRVSYEWLTLLGLGALSVAGALVVLRRSAVVLRQRHVLACVVALAAITLVAQRELLVSNVELIHLPQFGLLAV